MVGGGGEMQIARNLEAFKSSVGTHRWHCPPEPFSHSRTNSLHQRHPTDGPDGLPHVGPSHPYPIRHTNISPCDDHGKGINAPNCDCDYFPLLRRFLHLFLHLILNLLRILARRLPTPPPFCFSLQLTRA